MKKKIDKYIDMHFYTGTWEDNLLWEKNVLEIV